MTGRGCESDWLLFDEAFATLHPQVQRDYLIESGDLPPEPPSESGAVGLFQQRVDDRLYGGLTPEDLYAAVAALDWSALPERPHPGPGPGLPDRLVRDGRGQVIARLRRDPYDPAPA